MGLPRQELGRSEIGWCIRRVSACRIALRRACIRFAEVSRFYWNQGGLKSEMQHPAWIGMSVDCGLSLLCSGFDQLAEGLDRAAPAQCFAISGICPLRSSPAERDLRALLPWRKQAIRSLHSSPLGCA